MQCGEESVIGEGVGGGGATTATIETLPLNTTIFRTIIIEFDVEFSGGVHFTSCSFVLVFVLGVDVSALAGV